MLLVGRDKFVVVFGEQLFSVSSLEAAPNNGVLQLFRLTVNAIVPMPYQLHLTIIKDEHLDM